mgnify:CR=1 FL=1
MVTVLEKVLLFCKSQILMQQNRYFILTLATFEQLSGCLSHVTLLEWAIVLFRDDVTNCFEIQNSPQNYIAKEKREKKNQGKKLNTSHSHFIDHKFCVTCSCKIHFYISKRCSYCKHWYAVQFVTTRFVKEKITVYFTKIFFPTRNNDFISL